MSNDMKATRRAILAGAAAVPAATLPAIALAANPDAELMAAARAVEEAWEALSRTCKPLEDAETTAWQWRDLNPRPKMPKIPEDNTDALPEESNHDRRVRIFAKILDEPDSEWIAYEKASAAWEQSYALVERESGLVRARDDQRAACNRLSEARAALCAVQAATIEGLRVKARISILTAERESTDHPIAESIVDDLLEMQEPKP
jgi:hypothetical protein